LKEEKKFEFNKIKMNKKKRKNIAIHNKRDTKLISPSIVKLRDFRTALLLLLLLKNEKD